MNLFTAFAVGQLLCLVQIIYASGEQDQARIPDVGESKSDETIVTERKLTAQTQLLRHRFQLEVEAFPDLYDPKDVDLFMNDETNWAVERFLVQRSFNFDRTYDLVRKTLKWRNIIGINRLSAANFPCDLFGLGLIFEFGKTHSRNGEEAKPVIWIRLGALGKLVRNLEKLRTPKVIKIARNLLSRTRSAMHRHRTRDEVSKLSDDNRPVRPVPVMAGASARYDQTVMHALRAIAWWLSDWESKHPAGNQATLVLDFEGTDTVLSSWTIGDFLVGLDDHFPALFDRIIGFRYRPKIWSLSASISMFNRIFKSRLSSSPETDRKLIFVRHEPQIDAYIPRVDSDGFTMLPEHVSGECLGINQYMPEGCLEDADSLAESGLYDPLLLRDLRDEFYRVCKPRQRTR